MLCSINDFVTAGISATVGVALAFGFAAYLDARYRRHHPDDEADEERWRLEAYTLQYYDELEELDDTPPLTPEAKAALKDTPIDVETPQGRVIMYYDAQSETFHYYADTAAKLYYKVLDTVARQYAVEYKCKEICYNARTEWLKVLEKYKAARLRQQQGEPASPTDEETISVYAKYKKYNTEAASNANASASAIITEHSNKFKYRGRLADYANANANANVKTVNDDQDQDQDQDANVTTTAPPPHALSYADFKRNLLTKPLIG